MPLTQPIIVTEFDHRRLEGLVELLRARSARVPSNLAMLELELERAQVVRPEEVPPNVVTMNSTVQLVDLDTHEQLSVTVVFPGASDLQGGRVSVLAPVGLAVLGCHEGQELEWATPGRLRRLRVERVVFQPEAAGNYAI
jgi:regulator of nucleoside diphosphate kinase